MNEKADSTRSVADSLAERVARSVVHRLPNMDKVRVISDLKYSDVDNPYLLMDVYVPPDLKPHERCPVVILIHGGAGPEYQAKNWGFFQSWGRLIATAGMIAVTFTHRLSAPPQSLMVESASDVDRAIDYVRTNAESWQADRDRICVSVWSAGGPLLCAILRERPAFVRCFVAFYALLDLQQYAKAGDAATLEFLKGFSVIASLPEDASPMMPMLVARAGRDEVPMLNEALDRFTARALALNAPITVINHPSGVHGFDNQNDDERSLEIIRSVIEFMKCHLRLGQ